MIRRHLSHHLKNVETRIRRYRLLRDSGVFWFVASGAVLGLIAVLVGLQTTHASLPNLVVGSAVSASVILAVWNRFRRIARKSIAHSIERTFPDLNERLLTAVENQTGGEEELGYLQQQLVSEVLMHHRRNNWLKTVPGKRLFKAFSLNVAGVALFVVASFCLYRFEVKAVMETSVPDPIVIVEGADEYGISVEPGDTSIERGTGLVVIARFSQKLPADVTLVVAEQNAESRRIPLSKSLDDPLFGGQVSSVNKDAVYFIEYDNRRSEDYKITLFDFPELVRADVTVAFPEYTRLPESAIPDARSVSFVEGSTVTLNCILNKQVTSAKLIDDEETTLELKPGDSEKYEYGIAITPKKSSRYKLILVDADGRHNKYPPEFTLTVVPNQRPKLQLAFPAKDLKVSPLEEMPVEGNAWDDFGLKKYGVIYALAGKKTAEVVLGEDVSAKKTEQIHHLISVEEMAAEPDELVSYYLFADDFGPEGKLRRTYSDMYFAEVRHFEEIFREGRQPPGGQSKKKGGGQQKQAEELEKLQKQIVIATWKVFRRESTSSLSDEFGNDVGLIEESQKSALEKVSEIEKKLKDSKSKGLVKTIAKHMQAAVDSLTEASQQTKAEPLSPALSSEQAAYQALLKLRAREHQVSRSQKSQGGGGGGSSRSQQQLNQLEISNKENRYQTNKSAAQANAAANQEQLQVLNRLRELAQRQNEVNQKLKELQTALREAKTEKEKEELKRRLKRLREEEQRMLRDIDKLQERMDQPENQSQMSDSRKQLDQTRSQVLKSSEALEKGKLSQALNSGTRAERELKKMQEDFRKKTAGRFSEEMQDLKERSRELQEKQKNLAQQLDELQNGKRRSLRDSRKKDAIGQEMKDQKGRVGEILDKMRNVIQQAEQSEPLLSKQLYETVRKSREQEPEKALELTSELINRGLYPHAGEAEKLARQGIDTLKQGIEKAAEGVLGNELDALKQAQNQLENLTKSVQDELAQANPQSQDSQASRQSGKPHNSPSQQKSQQSGENSGKQSASNSKGKSSSSKQGGKQQASKSGDSKSGQSKSGQSKSGSGKSPMNSQQGGNSQGQGSSNQQANNSSSQPGKPNQSSSSILRQGGKTGGGGGASGRVLTGDNFQQWSDQMRNVEEMIQDPKLRAEAEKIRERARGMRVEFKRHSKEPNWDLVRTTVYQPLVEMQQKVAEEIAKRESKDALVPIDRDPVPERYSELVRRYYQELSNTEKATRQR